MKIDSHIAIVRSSIDGLSSLSQPSSAAIYNALIKYYARVEVAIVNTEKDLEQLVASKPDIVFLGMKYVPEHTPDGATTNKKVWVEDYLAEHGIACTGSVAVAHRLELHKPLAKQCVKDNGISTAPFYVAEQHTVFAEANIDLVYPLFIKPTNRGGGSGIDSHSVAHNFNEAATKVQSLSTDLGADALIEEYLTGREFSVAILKQPNSDEYWVMPIELLAPPDDHGERILSAQVKSEDSERHAGVEDPELKARLCELALQSFHALGARDYGRIDIRLDSSGKPQFLEANLIPSLIEGYGNFPKACMLNINTSYEPMLLHILELAAQRVTTN